MASYYSPLFNNAFPINTSTTPLEFTISKLLKQTKKRRAIMKALNGVVAGSTAADSHKRVAANVVEQGGYRPMEVVYDVNRVTTAGDIADDLKIFTRTSRTAVFTSKAGWFG